MSHPKGTKINRRAMLERTAQVAMAASVMHPSQSLIAAGLGEKPHKPLVWDAHAHLSGVPGTPEERVTKLLEYADRLGVDRVVFFLGFSRLLDPPPEQLRRDNDEVIRAVRVAPDRVFGFVYLNPNYVDESIQEFDRCVTHGLMVGVKLWVSARCHGPQLDPIVRHATKLRAPILQHIWYKTTGNLPGESTPGDLAALAARHPDAVFLGAHVGGNWERGIRAIRATSNVIAELSGSDPTAGMTEMAVRELGAKRVIFGSDYGGRSQASQLAKVTGADISDVDKQLILGQNLRQILTPICHGKGISL